MDPATDTETAGTPYDGLYRLGGAAALVIAPLLLGEVAVYAFFPRPASVLEHFSLFRSNGLVGLLTLDLLGMVSYLLFIPMILALYRALRRSSEAVASVAAVLFFVGIADFYATNTAFPVMTLSSQYFAAASEAERAMLLGAGQAMFTLFNENAFLVSYVLVSAAWALLSGAMLRGKPFSRPTAYAGILAGLSGILAVVLEHVLPLDVQAIAIALYFAAIVFLLVWVVLAGRRLYQLGAGR